MTDTRSLEMRLHKHADRLAELESKIENLLKTVEDLNANINKPIVIETTPIETTPITEYYEFKEDGEIKLTLS